MKGSSKNKNSADPTAIRIRDNQRRSRARHREFVETLQRKVHEYERQGIQASLDMQRAARDVAQENARLRDLLAMHGVSREEVDQYLATFANGAGAGSAAGSSGAQEASASPGGGGGAGGDVNARAGSVASTGAGAPSDSTTGPGRGPMSLRHLINADDHTPIPDLSRSSVSSSQGTSPMMDYHHVQSARQQSTYPAGSAPSTTPASPHEMPCGAAAQIIAGAQGHGDERLARRALGCQDSTNCMVRNTAVFQALDHP